MFYFTPAFSTSVKSDCLKFSWQDIFVDPPNMQFKNQTVHLDHRIGTEQVRRLCK